jgi:hypothetical protein
MKSHVAWIIIVSFFAALIGGFFIMESKTTGAPLDITLATTTAVEAISQSSSITPSLQKNVPDAYKEYRNEQFGFFLYYPPQLQPIQYADDRPEITVAFSAGDGEPGFQVYVAPIDGTTITNERFMRDEPSGVRKDLHNTAVAGVSAIEFQGFNANMGQTYEVWFIRDHLLYEVLTYKELEPWLNEIMSTWRFL